MTKIDWTTLPAGTKLRCIQGFPGRLTLGKEYELESYKPARNGYSGDVVICQCDSYITGVNWSDGYDLDGSQFFEVVKEPLPVVVLAANYQHALAHYNTVSVLLSELEDDLQGLALALVDRLRVISE